MFQCSCFSLCFFCYCCCCYWAWSLHSHIGRPYFDVCGANRHAHALGSHILLRSLNISFWPLFLSHTNSAFQIIDYCACACAFYQMSIGMINPCEWIFGFFGGDHFGRYLSVSIACSCNYLTKYILSNVDVLVAQASAALSIIKYALHTQDVQISNCVSQWQGNVLSHLISITKNRATIKIETKRHSSETKNNIKS